MKKTATIYHNPRCTKSRETLKRLQDKGLSPRIILYLEDPPDLATLKKLVKKLQIKPRVLVRTKEKIFAGLDLDLDDDAAVLAALAKNPILIERPIVVVGDRAVLGRPPENVDDLLG